MSLLIAKWAEEGNMFMLLIVSKKWPVMSLFLATKTFPKCTVLEVFLLSADCAHKIPDLQKHVEAGSNGRSSRVFSRTCETSVPKSGGAMLFLFIRFEGTFPLLVTTKKRRLEAMVPNKS